MILERKWMIPRRTFLKGAGVMLGLPLMEAMGKVLPKASPEAVAGSSAAPAVQAPVRMACIYFPNGVWEKNWFPKESGRDYDLPFSLEPLARHKEQMLVFSGLDKKHSHGGDGHYAKTANFLTGLLVRKTAGKDINVGSASIDQHMAQKIGHLTPLPSMELGIDPVISGIDSVVGYTRLYGCYISWLQLRHLLRAKSIPGLLMNACSASYSRRALLVAAAPMKTSERCSISCWKTPTACAAGSGATINTNWTNTLIRCAMWNAGWSSSRSPTRAPGDRISRQGWITRPPKVLRAIIRSMCGSCLI
jgi:hypothetical protein